MRGSIRKYHHNRLVIHGSQTTRSVGNGIPTRSVGTSQESRTTQSVEDGIPDAERGNESHQIPSTLPVESPRRGTPATPIRSSMLRYRLLIG